MSAPSLVTWFSSVLSARFISRIDGNVTNLFGTRGCFALAYLSSPIDGFRNGNRDFKAVSQPFSMPDGAFFFEAFADFLGWWNWNSLSRMGRHRM